MPKNTQNPMDIKVKNNKFFDYNSLRLILLASMTIILAVFLMGGISYIITKNAVVEKLKSRDLLYIAQSITTKIDSRIERAKETSLMLAKDPVIKDWIIGMEKDTLKGTLSKQRIAEIVHAFDYDNSFIVSNLTYHYWTETGELIDVMSINDDDDSWFFDFIEEKKSISTIIDYNNERKNTFAFINALMGDINDPLAVVGVGISLEDISDEFKSYKFGEQSNMWLVDKNANIYISEDAIHSGKSLREFVPSTIMDSINSFLHTTLEHTKVLEYKNAEGMVYDIIYQKLQSTDLMLVLQIPRKESAAFIDTIKINTLIACFIAIILLVVIFYLISKKIADPYKRAIQLNREMERLVNERTLELKEKNQKIIDSIEYAQMIQESILPSPQEMQNIFEDYFLLWKPRDIVGGDFYYTKSFDSGSVFILGDCTGHGVPGALMTMTVNSILNYIVDEDSIKNPGYLLKRLNVALKQTLYGRNSLSNIDDGLDAGIIYMSKKEGCIFAGARISLSIKGEDYLKIFKGDRKGIGYKNTDDTYKFKNYSFVVSKDDIFYMTTDGYLHQNGGEKNFSLGKTKFNEIIDESYHQDMHKQKLLFEEKLKAYMKNEVQRDDITVIGFKPHRL
ncbi:cache domain-containing protein [Clostridiaceae bacterium 35-E11]